jgi:excisionase family DNA binding protein
VATYLTLDEAAEILGLESVAICRLVRQGVLPGVKTATEWRISHADVLAYKDANQ